MKEKEPSLDSVLDEAARKAAVRYLGGKEAEEEDGYCDATPLPLPEPPCGLERPCPLHDVPEPTRFAWHRDGDLVSGTLADWVKSWENDYYSGEQSTSMRLWFWADPSGEPDMAQVMVERGEKNEEGDVPYRMRVPGLPDEVHVTIDGRA